MSEFSGARGVIINGREQNGRTHRRSDGTYETLDLVGVRPGEALTVVTDKGSQEFVKTKAGEHDSSLHNWTLGSRAVHLALSEPNAKGTNFRHHGVVLRECLGMEVSYPHSEHPLIIHSLGAIASIEAYDTRRWRALLRTWKNKLFTVH